MWDLNNVNNIATIVFHNQSGCSTRKNEMMVWSTILDESTMEFIDRNLSGILYSRWRTVLISLKANFSIIISTLEFRIAESIVGLLNLSVEVITVGTKTVYFPR